VIGSIDSHDAVCRALANASSCVVVSVEYRLAPEHPFPAAVEDAYAAMCWMAGSGARLGIDASRIALAGDSAGGNLAIAAALMARDRAFPDVAFQLLAYPVATTDLERGFDPNWEGVALELAELRWHQENYLPAATDASSPLVSPLDHADLRDLPPAHIISAACDPIRPQGELYAHALQAAGVPVELVRYPGMIHGFMQMLELEEAKEALQRAGAALRSALSGSA
jgi:acetyl esterase/lipase